MITSSRNAKYALRVKRSVRNGHFTNLNEEAKALEVNRKRVRSIAVDVSPRAVIRQEQWSEAVFHFSTWSNWVTSSVPSAIPQQLVGEKALIFHQMPRSPINLAGILEKYRLGDDRKSLLLFLNEHRDVANFLIDSYEKIRKYFASNPLRLRVSQDPEDPHLKMLVLSINANPSEVDESYEKFVALEDEWLMDTCDLSDRLCVKLDFE